MQPKAKAKAKATSFFFAEKDLGVQRYDVGFRQALKCELCSQQISTTEVVRVAYAFHCKRPHAYLHLPCVASLEKRFLEDALVKLAETALPNDSDVATRVDAVRRSNLRKLHE